VPGQRWIDLHDPDEAALRDALPVEIHEVALAALLRAPRPNEEPRPRLEAHGDYVFGILAFPFAQNGGVRFQEVDLIATPETFLTVRKTAPGQPACNIDVVRDAAARRNEDPGLCLYRLVDEIAERFLDLLDTFDEQIDVLEDHVSDWGRDRIRSRISSLRHDILHTRRVLAPTRDAARAVLDDRVELDLDVTLFPRDVELRFADAYDKLLRATDGLDLSRDLLAGVRDFVQSEIANDQNEIMKRLAAVASLLLVPTFIVGLYGQNFFHMPELRWQYGYIWSWGLILVTTAVQLWFYRRKRWI
jgi:magnesium transporter